MLPFRVKTTKSKNINGVEVVGESINVYPRQTHFTAYLSFYQVNNCGLQPAGPTHKSHEEWHAVSEFDKSIDHVHAAKVTDALITPDELECFLNTQKKLEDEQFQKGGAQYLILFLPVGKNELPHLDPQDRADLIKEYKTYYEANIEKSKTYFAAKVAAEHLKRKHALEEQKAQDLKDFAARQKQQKEEALRNTMAVRRVKGEIFDAGYATGRAFFHSFLITMIDKYLIPQMIETFHIKNSAQNILKASLHAATTFIVSFSTIKSGLDFFVKWALKKYLNQSANTLGIDAGKLESLINQFSSAVATIQNPMVLMELSGAFAGAYKGEQAALYLMRKFGKFKIEDNAEVLNGGPAI